MRGGLRVAENPQRIQFQCLTAFFDDGDEEIAALHETIKTWAGGSRFEELGYSLTFGEDGKIDLAVLPEYVDKARARMFAVPQTEATK